MNKILWLFIFIFSIGCSDSNEKKKDDVIFFQVKQFFENELKDIQSTPYFIYKIEINGDNRDSTTLTKDSVAYYASAFLQSDINNSELKEHYEESVFHDQTTGSFSLSYSTSKKDLDVQNVNVLLHEDGETVKRIFIRRYLTRGDSSIIEQLNWKPNESFENNRVIQLPNQPEKTQRTIVVWNPK
ncbi:hypothetical protein [Aridibaculum aurantiacum]|uniref:hypothetical protein n=1 Tax=Aridibaculum aurantiacum TaxID=2810307 RepID=UPI001A96C7E6|nr:hypothetical protein [Aridibaculum aurantiacum]